ncbi:MAG: aldehyde oxidase and xanthine dehydrogenase molybdopterin binding protein, partial [Gemmatimonadetes bacterium]|nr:aldehyde oxidase and xanthine dehydrogenase molybdopterin binding protein [Gemmatimonadota bacterium]
MTMRNESVGEPMDRIDGRLKVTGAAKYSAEMPAANMSYAVIVQSTVANGRITKLDTRNARAVPGVIEILTHENAPKLPEQKANPPASRVLTLLQDAQVRYNGQPIAVVIADTLEHATEAAHRVNATYSSTKPVTEMKAGAEYKPAESMGRKPDSLRGDVVAGLAKAEVRIEHTYLTPIENHNPMEPHGTVAVPDGDKLTVYDSTQYVSGDRDTIAKTLGLPPENVRLVCYFTGGGFGSKGSVWSHVPLAAMAARVVQRPVKLVLSRRQMYGPVGARPETEQKITLGAMRDGSLTAVRHESISHTSRFEDFLEPAAMQTRLLYECPNIETKHRLVKLDVGTPTFQRAPGHSTGTYALESAMDELAVALDMDPLALRLKNYAEKDPESGHPWSSKSLRECYRVASEKFGWSKRIAKPGSMRDGNVMIGYGMATATYPTNRQKATAIVYLTEQGGRVHALVQSATQDIGTGTYTVMTQVAADALGLPVEQVRFELGDSRMPPSPVSGGSMTAASTGSAVNDVCKEARRRLDAQIAAGQSLAANPLTVTLDSAPGAERQQYSMHSFGAVFAEVRVDRDLGEIRVPRIVAAYGAGRILNAKLAHSQLVGGVVWGVGMALEEETIVDRRTGR